MATYARHLDLEFFLAYLTLKVAVSAEWHQEFIRVIPRFPSAQVYQVMNINLVIGEFLTAVRAAVFRQIQYLSFSVPPPRVFKLFGVGHGQNGVELSTPVVFDCTTGAS